jgi:2-(1,2-epoxy-1,2-dihydrophenyl)acetyl-CoA isomerase
MSYECLLYDVNDRVATITLNRPRAHETRLSQKLVEEIVSAVSAADQDPDIRVLIIRGAGKGVLLGV